MPRKLLALLHHRENGATYDFTGETTDLETIQAANRSLATTSESPFVQTLVCAQLTENGMTTLTNAALRIYSPAHMNEESASSHEAFERILREHFTLTIDRSEALWTRVADSISDGCESASAASSYFVGAIMSRRPRCEPSSDETRPTDRRDSPSE